MAQKKKGRPTSDDKMTDRIFVRVDKETKEKLEKCREVLGSTRSEIVRQGIEMVHDSLNKK